MSNEFDMQTLTLRMLSLWQEQISLMGQDTELMSYGESMFKAMGMPVPDMEQAPSPSEEANFSANNEPEIHEPATQNGAASDALSSQQRTAMVDELTRRIDELASQIAEHEGGTVSPKPD